MRFWFYFGFSFSKLVNWGREWNQTFKLVSLPFSLYITAHKVSSTNHKIRSIITIYFIYCIYLLLFFLLDLQHFSGYCSRDEITSMCSVRNLMWMGTTSGSIKVFHAPTLKVKFTCALEREGPEGKTNCAILDILYVEEMRTVLVANFSGEVWSFYDSIVDDGLRLQCKITLPDDSPCYHLAKVSMS